MEFIPTKQIPAYTELLTLEGVVYEFGFTWNTREAAWMLSITRDGEALLAGIKVVDGFELIGRFANFKLPPGLILTMDLGKIKQVPGFDQLGSVVKLAYLTESEAESGII